MEYQNKTAEYTAELILTEELNNGIRHARFEHKDNCQKISSGTINIAIENHDLRFHCTVERFCKTKIMCFPSKVLSVGWKKIKIIPSEPNNCILGKFSIQVDGKNVAKRKFNTVSGPFEQKLLGVETSKLWDSITITMDIYYENAATLSMIEDFTKLLESYSSHDVTFFVGNEVMSAHRVVISACSDVFYAIFESDMLENKTGKVHIEDIKPKTFKQLLRYVYCGRVDTSDVQELLDLIVAADKYSITNLVKVCAFLISYLMNVDDFDNLDEIIMIADRVNADALKKYCLDKDKEITYFKFFDSLLIMKAELISKEVLNYGETLTKFACEIEIKVLEKYKSMTCDLLILIEDYDLKLEFRFVRQYSHEFYFNWGTIEFPKCDKKISGKVEIQGVNVKVESIEFNLGTEIYEKAIRFERISNDQSASIKITIKICRDDERFYSSMDDFTKLLEKNENYCDVKFIVQDREILAHELILSARCDELSEILNETKEQNKIKVVEINGIESQTFEKFLRFIYSGKVETKSIDELIKLLKAAAQFSLKSLFYICEYRASCELRNNPHSYSDLKYLQSIQYIIPMGAFYLKKVCQNLIIKYKLHERRRKLCELLSSHTSTSSWNNSVWNNRTLYEEEDKERGWGHGCVFRDFYKNSYMNDKNSMKLYKDLNTVG